MIDENVSLQAQFFEDALDLLTDAETIVLELERDGFDGEQLNSLFRVFHTLKGNANMVGLEPLGRICHALESRLDGVRRGSSALDEELLQQTLEVIDLLEQTASSRSLEFLTEKIAALAVKLNHDPEPVIDPSGSPPKTESDNESRKSMTAFLNILSRVLGLSGRLGRSSGEDPVELLVDMGMDIVDLRSALDYDRHPSIVRRTVYLEKFLTAMLRTEAEYDPVNFELHFLLLEEISRLTELELRHVSWIRRVVVDEPIQFRALVDQEIQEGSGDILAVELRISEQAMYQIADVFNQCRRLREKREQPVLFLHPGPGTLKKASALLGAGTGEGYPEIYDDLLHGMMAVVEKGEV
jgi:chemotaxis protein histidine kinase CheA